MQSNMGMSQMSGISGFTMNDAGVGDGASTFGGTKFSGGKKNSAEERRRKIEALTE